MHLHKVIYAYESELIDGTVYVVAVTAADSHFDAKEAAEAHLEALHENGCPESLRLYSVQYVDPLAVVTIEGRVTELVHI